MIKRTILLSFLALTNLFAHSQTYSSIINDKEIYAFLDWIGKHERRRHGESKVGRRILHPNLMPWDSLSFIMSKDTILINKKFWIDNTMSYVYRGFDQDTIFNEQDKDFGLQQFKAIHGKVLQQAPTGFKLVNGRDTRNMVLHFSVPIFSFDRQYVIVRRATSNCGMLCGDSAFYIYRRYNKGWTLVTMLYAIAS